MGDIGDFRFFKYAGTRALAFQEDLKDQCRAKPAGLAAAAR